MLARVGALLPLQPCAQQQHIGLIIIPGHVGMAPFVPVLALEPQLARQFVSDERRGRIALVLARRADIVDARTTDLERRDQPAPEGMIDFERNLARERARDPKKNRLVDRGARGEPEGGERAREPAERSIEGEPTDPRQRRILIAALNPTQRHITGERTLELEGGAAFHIAAIRIAAYAAAIDREIVHSPVDTGLDEGLDAGRELIACAQHAEIAVEVAVGVACRAAVSEGR